MALFAAAFCHAQNATITGTVKDGDMNDFLIGASVFVEGTAHGTIADANGSYNLSVPYGKVTVCCDFLGYKPQEIELELEAGEVRTLNITMYSDSEVLEGVVVSAQAKGQAAEKGSERLQEPQGQTGQQGEKTLHALSVSIVQTEYFTPATSESSPPTAGFHANEQLCWHFPFEKRMMRKFAELTRQLAGRI